MCRPAVVASMSLLGVPALWGGLLVAFFGFLNVPVQRRAGTVAGLCTEYLTVRFC